MPNPPFTPPPYLSPSQIETFSTCPLKWKFSRIDKIKEPPTEATVMGNFVHEVLEELYRLPVDDRTQDTARSIMRDRWDMKFEAEANKVLTEGHREFRWRSWWCIETYFKMEDPQSFTPKGIEFGLDGNIGKVRLKGFIDRFDSGPDGLEVVDYKTGKVPPPNFQDAKFFQLLLYADLLAAKKREPVSKVHLLFVKDGVRLTEEVTPETLAPMREKVQTTFEAIAEGCRTGEFTPKVSKLCDWCHFKPQCPAWSKK
jgi:putative RecB family exonuclease